MLRTDDFVSVSMPDLMALATGFLTERGARPGPAAAQATHLVEAELRGHPSHGVRRLEVLGSRMENGLIDPGAQPEIDWVARSALRVDGRRGFGPIAAHRAIDELLDRLAELGVAAASLHRTHHLGMLAPYLERITSAGAVGLILSSTEGLVHPWGGAGALIGTNPLGIGVPAKGGDLILDMSTGAVSAGKILDYRARGKSLPDGWAVDAAGSPTVDPAAAVTGAISPFGGAKGYALGLALGAMVGALTGTALGPEVRGTLDADRETTKGDVIVVIDAGRLAGTDMRTRVAAYFDAVRDSGIGQPVAVPGDRARAARARREAEGLAVPFDVWKLLTTPAADPARRNENNPNDQKVARP